MSEKVLKVEYEGELKIGETILPCYVLEDGQRVLSGRGVQNLLKLTEEKESKQKTAGSRLKRLFNYKTFKPILFNKLDADQFQIIKCRKGKTIIHGYNPTSLVDLCDAIIDVKNSGVNLAIRQRIIAKQAEIFIRSIAKVGIIALIDEATGYQDIRAKKALADILEKYIAKEYREWTKTFPDEFYREMFRLKGWIFDPKTVKRPIIIARYTNDVVYERLAPGVLKILREKNPVTPKGYRKQKHFQWLTGDIGHPKLREHLAGIMALMRAAPNWRAFYNMVQRSYPKLNEQIPLAFIEEYEDIK